MVAVEGDAALQFISPPQKNYIRMATVPYN